MILKAKLKFTFKTLLNYVFKRYKDYCNKK